MRILRSKPEDGKRDDKLEERVNDVLGVLLVELSGVVPAEIVDSREAGK